jgi:hypothetical protein
MNKRFTIIVALIFALTVSACVRESETTLTKTAKLTVHWVEPIDQKNIQKKPQAIAPEIAQQFKEIGAYKITSKITIASNESKQEFDVEFLREIGNDEADVLMPKIRKILNNREIKVTFQSAETTTTKSIRLGIN